MNRIKTKLRRMATCGNGNCPQCGSASVMSTVDGTKHCMDCQYQW